MSDSRKIKFKTLDNKITELVVDKNVNLVITIGVYSRT